MPTALVIDAAVGALLEGAEEPDAGPGLADRRRARRPSRPGSPVCES